jgi:hypothetical protein
MKLLTFDTRKQKKVLVGEINGDKLVKKVTANHFMRIVNGYGIQYEALAELSDKKIKTIEVHELEGLRRKWTATVKEWIEKSKTMDFGNGKQVFLSLKYMHEIKEKLNLDESVSTAQGLSQMVGTPQWEKVRAILHK